MTRKKGYAFKRFEGAAEPVVRDLPIPGEIRLPLPADFTPALSAGDRVGAGDITGTTTAGYPVYAPASGTVVAFENGFCVIGTDGSSAYGSLETHPRNLWELPQEQAFALAHDTGILPFCGIASTNAETARSVKHVVINAVHNSPVDQRWTAGMFGAGERFEQAVNLIGVLFPEAQLTVGVNRRNARWFAQHSPDIDVRTIADLYPQEHPELVVRNCTGRRLVSPKGVRNETIETLPFEACLQLAETLAGGKPPVERILLVAGPGIARPGWYRIRIGTPLSFIRSELAKSGEDRTWRTIRGDLLTGNVVGEASEVVGFDDTALHVIREEVKRELFRFVTPGFFFDSYPKTTAAEVLPVVRKHLDSGRHGGNRPCIQCSYCAEVCPVDIYPFLIWKHVDIDEIEETFRLRPYECIGCGICDYVCPSRIDIAEGVRTATEAWRAARKAAEEGADATG